MRRIAGSLVLLLAFCPSQAQVPSRNTPMDRAIERGLEFLYNTQDRSDGSWRANGSRNPAISSLAIMAFLSAGHVPGEGQDRGPRVIRIDEVGFGFGRVRLGEAVIVIYLGRIRGESMIFWTVRHAVHPGIAASGRSECRDRGQRHPAGTDPVAEPSGGGRPMW